MNLRWACALACCAVAPSLEAHGFGQRYDLPLPLSWYIGGAAMVVALSCVMLVVLMPVAREVDAYPRFDLLAPAPLRWLASPLVVGAARVVAVAVYAFLIVAGFIGNPSPFRNIVPIAIWALWWVGLAYCSALVGDLWRVVNPLETLFAAAERLHAKLRRGLPLSRALCMPAWVGAWPAVALYLVCLWGELVWEGSDSPRLIAWAMLGYSALAWAGMRLFGREAWLAHGEAFNRVFGVFARFSPTAVRLEGRRVVAWELRPYAVGLLDREPAHASDIMLVMVVLAAVSFDGFLETPAWATLTEAVSPDGGHAALLRSAGLVVAPLLFLAVYRFFCALIARCGRWRAPRGAITPTTGQVAGLFAMTLVPIAIAYLFAHYLSFLAIAWQYAITLVSDPLGRGANLFGTANHLVRPGIVDARLVWIVSVASIVTGHVAALYLSHVVAMRAYADRRAAVQSQLPMLVLMVGYTMLSLWIIAQPIVTSR